MARLVAVFSSPRVAQARDRLRGPERIARHAQAERRHQVGQPNPAAALALSEDQKFELDTLLRNGNTPQKVALRCGLLLLAHEGVTNQTIARQLNLSRPTILAARAPPLPRTG